MCTKIKMKSYDTDTHNKRRRRPRSIGTSTISTTTLLILILSTCHIHSTVSAVTLPSGSDVDLNTENNEDTPLINFGGRRSRLSEHRNRRRENTRGLLHNDNMNDIQDGEEEGGVVEDNLHNDILNDVGGEDSSSFIPRILKKKKDKQNQDNKKVRTTNKKKQVDSINKEAGNTKRKKAGQRKRAKDTPPKKKDIQPKNKPMTKKKTKKNAALSDLHIVDTIEKLKKKDKKLLLSGQQQQNTDEESSGLITQKMNKKEKKLEYWNKWGKSGKSKSGKSKGSKGGGWGKDCVCIKWSNGGWSKNDNDAWWASDNLGRFDFTYKFDTDAMKQDKLNNAASRFADPNSRSLSNWEDDDDDWYSGKSGKSRAKTSKSSQWGGWGNKTCKKWKCNNGWKSNSSKDGWGGKWEPTLSPTMSPTWEEYDDDWYWHSTWKPTLKPTYSKMPSVSPSALPSDSPSKAPSKSPTASPSSSPTSSPSKAPTTSPTSGPANSPSKAPTTSPSTGPITAKPTSGPITATPTSSPNKDPTPKPITTGSPSSSPTSEPSKGPTSSPSSSPTVKILPSETIFPPTLSDDDHFGTSIDTYKDDNRETAIIGALGESDLNEPGEAYVYDYIYNEATDTFSWIGRGRLDPTSVVEPPGSNPYLAPCGTSVAVWENYYFVGCPQDSTNGTNIGSVHIFERTGTDSNPQYTETFLYPPSGAGVSALFGWSLSINTQGILAIGARADDQARGSVYMYKFVDDNTEVKWSLMQELPKPDDVDRGNVPPGNFGWSVAVDDVVNDRSTVYVGAPYQKNPDDQVTGEIFIYAQQEDGRWVDPGTSRIPGRQSGGEFGSSLATDGRVLAIGAPGESTLNIQNAGRVHIVPTTPGVLPLTPFVDAEENAVKDGRFGFSVALRNDGYLAVGEPSEPSPDLDDISPGATYLYKPSEDGLLYSFERRLESSKSFDEFGFSVSFGGETLLVGKPNDNIRSTVGAGTITSYTIGAPTTNTVADPRTPEETTTPSFSPTVGPTLEPTVQPDTGKPTVKPKPPPTFLNDNQAATLQPVTNEPSSKQPTQEPTLEPSYYPTIAEDPPTPMDSNPVSLSIPEKRYVEWSLLSETDRSVATFYLTYTEDTWNLPGSNELEEISYVDLTNNGKAGVISLGMTEEVYDCHINHYYGYWWSDLEEVGLDQYYTILGWNANLWDNDDGDVPNTEDLYWSELTSEQQTAASNVCFFEDLWNGESIPDW